VWVVETKDHRLREEGNAGLNGEGDQEKSRERFRLLLRLRGGGRDLAFAEVRMLLLLDILLGKSKQAVGQREEEAEGIASQPVPCHSPRNMQKES
jgi:hypothetical protein